jgi:hypothetical protein
MWEPEDREENQVATVYCVPLTQCEIPQMKTIGITKKESIINLRVIIWYDPK